MDKKKQNKIILIVSLVSLFAFFIILSLTNECTITNEQQAILSSNISTTAEGRAILMTNMQKVMKPKDYICRNNPQQLLINKFLSVSLE